MGDSCIVCTKTSSWYEDVLIMTGTRENILARRVVVLLARIVERGRKALP
jgi:hypothetical protein